MGNQMVLSKGSANQMAPLWMAHKSNGFIVKGSQIKWLHCEWVTNQMALFWGTSHWVGSILWGPPIRLFHCKGPTNQMAALRFEDQSDGFIMTDRPIRMLHCDLLSNQKAPLLGPVQSGDSIVRGSRISWHHAFWEANQSVISIVWFPSIRIFHFRDTPIRCLQCEGPTNQMALLYCGRPTIKMH